MVEGIEQQFSQARQAGQQAISFAEQGAGLPQMLRQAVTERLQASPLFGQREQAAEQVLTSAPRARTELAQLVQAGARGEAGGAILSPTQQSGLISAQRAADVVPLLSLNDLLQAQTGGVETAVGAGLQGFDILSQANQARAQLAQTGAQNAFERDLANRELALRQATAGAGSQPSVLEQLLLSLLQPGGGETPGSFIADEESQLNFLLPGGQPPSESFAGAGQPAPRQPGLLNFLGGARNTVSDLLSKLFPAAQGQEGRSTFTGFVGR